MLDYEWGSSTNPPPPILLSGEQPEPAFNPLTTHSLHLSTFIDNTYLPPTPPYAAASASAFGTCYGGFYDQYTMGSSSSSDQNYDQSVAVDGGGGGLAARIGLNLGGRTYFSSEEEEFVNRLYRRARTGVGEPGLGSWAVRCQAEGCNADLREAKHYHRRHKVCEFHSKASTVITAGLTQRFCQQCSRFHVLAEFDNGKRSCRKRLADHNRRRRKIQHSNQGTTHNSHPLQTITSSTDQSAARSAMESSGQSAWSVTVAVSPARMTTERLNQRPY